MRICMDADYEGMSRRAAAVMADQVRENPRSVLGLATGASPVGMYAELSRRCRAGQITFRDVTTVNLDEYYGLTPDHEMSYRYFMEKNFFSLIDIPRENTHLPNGASLSPALECSRYDRLIESLGGIDLQLLGIGHGFGAGCEGQSAQDQEKGKKQGAYAPREFVGSHRILPVCVFYIVPHFRPSEKRSGRFSLPLCFIFQWLPDTFRR